MRKYVKRLFPRKKKIIRKYKKRNLNRKKFYNQSKIYTYTRWAPTTELYLPTNNLTASYSYSFTANSVANVTDFTNLFDQYKIKGVKLEFRLMTNPDSTVQPSNQSASYPPYLYPTLWTVIDKDDDGTITLDQMRQHQGCKRSVLRPNQIVSRYVPYPTTLGMAYKSSISTAYINNKSTWVDCADISTPHYGIKTVIDTEGLANAGNYTVRLDMKFYLAFKGVL